MKKYALILSVVFLFIGCSKEKNPVSIIDTFYVNNPKVFYCWLKAPTQNGILYSDPIVDPSSTSVTMSWGTQSQTLFSYLSNGQMYFYSGCVHYFDDTTVTVTIIADSDTGSGCIQVPSGTSLLTPAEYDTIPVENINCTWTKAQRADWYKLNVYYNVIDTLGYYYGSTNFIDTFLVDTIFTIPLSYYSSSIAQYYQFQILVEPYAGPLYSPNGVGNISGKIKGFIYGVGNPGYSHFYVGSPVKIVKSKKKYSK
jgi:hypothetical protein